MKNQLSRVIYINFFKYYTALEELPKNHQLEQLTKTPFYNNP